VKDCRLYSSKQSNINLHDLNTDNRIKVSLFLQAVERLCHCGSIISIRPLILPLDAGVLPQSDQSLVKSSFSSGRVLDGLIFQGFRCFVFSSRVYSTFVRVSLRFFNFSSSFWFKPTDTLLFLQAPNREYLLQ
jgi:hypothetical protein